MLRNHTIKGFKCWDKEAHRKETTVSKITKNIYRSYVQVTFNFPVISYINSSFIPNKTTFTKHCLTMCISTFPKFHGSGVHSKRNCLQDQANFHKSRAWQIVLVFNTETTLVKHRYHELPLDRGIHTQHRNMHGRPKDKRSTGMLKMGPFPYLQKQVKSNKYIFKVFQSFKHQCNPVIHGFVWT